MKDWQHGYDLEYLKSLQTAFDRFNSYSVSPFSAMTKNVIADRLHTGRLKIYNHNMSGKPLSNVMLDVSISQTNGFFNAFFDVHIARKLKGDNIIHAYSYSDPDEFAEVLNNFYTLMPTFIWVWIDDTVTRKVVEDCGYEYLGSKVSSFGEIKALYFGEDVFDSVLFDAKRDHPILDPLENVCLKKIKTGIDVSPVLQAVDCMDYTNHYSNYNKKKAWSAISFRGYTDDPSFITKPIEMNKKWKKEHEHIEFELQDTPLRKQFPEVDRLFDFLDGDIHRIRLMKLKPGGGELQRHTDLVDPDLGIRNGKLARLHFPIVTNPSVLFASWSFTGIQTVVNMRVGECWYLDIRKPHTAINNGTEDRIHLVVDVEVTDTLRSLL